MLLDKFNNAHVAPHLAPYFCFRTWIGHGGMWQRGKDFVFLFRILLNN
jgi:hypothetical protein